MRFRVISAAACMLALCWALVGCGGMDTSKYTGDWELSSTTIENLDDASLNLAKSMGLDIALTLNEDGTGTFKLLDNVMDATWEASSETEGKLVFDRREATINVNDSELVLVDGSGQTMTFTRK